MCDTAHTCTPTCTPACTHTHTHIPNHSSASHKAVPVNCAIKALKGVVEEIKLLWKSMTDMTGRPQRQASNTLYPPPHLSLRHTHTQPTFFPCPSLLHSDHHFILSGWISNQRKKKKTPYWKTCECTSFHLVFVYVASYVPLLFMEWYSGTIASSEEADKRTARGKLRGPQTWKAN